MRPADPVSLGKQVARAGALVWCGMVALGLSTVILLAVLSRHLHQQGFAGLSAVFGLLFIASLIPSGIPLRSAALIADGAPPPRITRKIVIPSLLAGTAISPLLGYLLGLPTLSVALIVAQVLLSFPLAIRRGGLIAFHRFTALGANMLLEAILRVALGSVAGFLWGINGLVAGLALATLLALLILPTTPVTAAQRPRPLTPMFDTWFSVVLLGVLVQMDILLAARALSRTAAVQYDVAAVPAKGVYLVLAAVSLVVFPYVRSKAQARNVVIGAMATMVLGLAVTSLLVVFRGVIGHILGQASAPFWLLICLGCAMSIAGATGVIVNCDVALGIVRPWPPLLLGLFALCAIWFSRPSAAALGATVLGVQAFTLLLSLWVCLHGQRGPVMASKPPGPAASSQGSNAR